MVAGGIGALAATTPLEFALRFASWRTIFVVLAALTAVVAVAIWLARARHAEARARAELRRAVGRVCGACSRIRASGGSRRSAGFGMGSFMAVQGLWAVPWMMDVDGNDPRRGGDASARDGRRDARGLPAASACSRPSSLVAASAPRHLFAAGFALNAVALAC